jgi:hypothetical protein
MSPLVNAARDHICGLILGEALTAFNNANAYLGVGDSATAFATSQTDLQAATNKVRVAMMATYPSRSANAMTFQSSFGSAVGNFAWAEVAAFNASTAAVMLFRFVQALGTKASGSTWQLTVTETVTV